jgi:hypothetical protein
MCLRWQSKWEFRLVPAFLTLLSVILFYYFTLELLGSKVASMLAAVLVITAPAVYYTHVWSAGVVRALALCFCLGGLLFYVRSLRNFSWRNFLLAGLSFGLMFTTHWLYVVFAALVGLACLISEWKLSRLPIAFGILMIALLVASPWLILILERHGASTLLLAASSHRNVDFFMSLNEFPVAIRIISENLEYVTGNWFFTALALPGFILLLIQKKFHIPLSFIFILTMGDASFFREILAGMMAGTFSAEIFRLTPRLATLKNANRLEFLKLTLPLLVAVCFLLSTVNGLSRISQYQPLIDGHSLRMASFVKKNSNPDATYLFIGRFNEAEWFPYLFDRTPVFAPWGSEWKGTYIEQSDILIALRECELQKSWNCMEDIQQKQSVFPDFLVIPNKRWLILEVKDTHAWELLYRDDRYLVWKRNN